MTRFLTLALVTLAVLAPARGAAQTAEDLVARHLAARGGAEKLKAIRTIRFHRTYGTFGGNIPVLISKKRPGMFRTDQEVAGRPRVVRGLDAGAAWEQIGDKTLRRPEAVEAELRETDGDFDGFLVDYAAKGHRVEYEGRAREGGVDTHVLRVTLRSGAVRRVYLDATTFLERKQTGTMTVPPVGEVDVTLLYSDWRDVDGVMFPFAIDEERSAPGMTYAIYTDRIEINPPLDDALFRMP